MEKSTPYDYPLLRLQRELYPAAKEILLVRDFRDTFASRLAFNARNGFDGFGLGPIESDEEHLLQFRDTILSILHDYTSRGGASRLVRYEDLILAPEETLAGVLAWLGTEATPAVVGAMLAAASRETPQMVRHRTSPDVAASIGRWKRDLPPALRAKACELLENALLEFGYRV